MQDRIWEHMQVLVETIGARPQGSAKAQAAEEYIAGQLAAAGLTVERQTYPCPTWRHASTRLEMGDELLPARANPFSPPCDIEAPALYASTLGELEVADLRGKVAVLYGDLSGQPVAAKGWFLKAERDERIVTALEDGGALAVLVLQQKAGDLDRLIEDDEFLLPSVTLPRSSGLRLLGSRGRSPLKLRIDAEKGRGRAANVVGRTQPARPQGRLVICAHYDTKVDTPGACDNAGGVAVLLALATSQAQLPEGPRYPLEFVAFCGEEYLPIGDDEYVRRAGADLGAPAGCINMDGMGYLLSALSIAPFNASGQQEARMRAITARHPGVVWVEPWPQSNHSTFTFRGFPALALSSSGLVHVSHTDGDTLACIDPVALDAAHGLVSELLAARVF